MCSSWSIGNTVHVYMTVNYKRLITTLNLFISQVFFSIKSFKKIKNIELFWFNTETRQLCCVIILNAFTIVNVALRYSLFWFDLIFKCSITLVALEIHERTFLCNFLSPIPNSSPCIILPVPSMESVRGSEVIQAGKLALTVSGVWQGKLTVSIIINWTGERSTALQSQKAVSAHL